MLNVAFYHGSEDFNMHLFRLLLGSLVAILGCLPAYAGVATPELDNSAMSGLVVAFTISFFGYKLLKLRKSKTN